MSKRILLVGHCGVDGPRLKDELSKALPGDDGRADQQRRRPPPRRREGADLLLVNREPVGFDARVWTSSSR